MPLTSRFTRRKALAGLASLVGAGVATEAVRRTGLDSAAAADGHMAGHAKHGSAHAGFAAGRTVDPRANGFDPSAMLRDFDWGTTQRLPGGRVLREWSLVAIDKEIEVAPGVKFSAWTYNSRVPGPTLRCREGDRLRIRFLNGGSHPHTIHFHGVHPAAFDGVPGVGEDLGGGLIEPGSGSRTSSTPSRSGCTTTTATRRRSPPTSPRASTARSSSIPSRGGRPRTSS